jgi:hypothetical protein
MSSRIGLNSLSGVQEVLLVLLMLISFIAIFYSDIDAGYKIGIAALVFGIIFLASMATQILKQGIPQKKS